MKVKKPRVWGFLALAGAVLAGLVLLWPSTPAPAPGEAELRAQNEPPPDRAEPTASRPIASAQPTAPEAAGATRTVTAPAPARLWAAPAETKGERLAPKSAS